MKTIIKKIILILLGLMLFGCSPTASTIQNITVTAKPLATSVPTNQPATLQPTTSPLNIERGKILSEIQQLADDYNAQVEQYRQKEQAQIIVDPNTNQEKMELSINAINNLSPLYDQVSEQVGDLSEKYWELYQKDHHTDPEFNTWETNELKNGTVIKLYNPDNKVFYRILVGDSFGADRLKWKYVTQIIALSNAPSEELMNLDIQEIQKFDSGTVSLVGISAYPPYRSDIELTRYETEKTSYLLYTDLHEFIEVVPKEAPPTDRGGSLEDLKAKAVEVIKLLSPNTEVNNLTIIQHEKAGAYFFRWEDRTKTFLDDGATYPFIQVALNGNGELLNYNNTLPLAR